MLLLALFFAGSAAIVKLSWRPLKSVHAHGFYRFFAFEFLLGIILLNAREWYTEPLSARQLVSCGLGVASIALAFEGFRLLRVLGRPSPARTHETNFGFENTTRLVTTGAYRFIRHPLYASLLALAWCAYLKKPLALSSIALASGATAFLAATAVAEERENVLRFGADYEAYMKRTRRFIPLVF